MTPFLQKLAENGFAMEDEDDAQPCVAASMGLNRMQSLSTRKNDSLRLEVSSNTETGLRYEKFGFFWTCCWYDEEGKRVEYEDVRNFYKQLKRFDSEKAREFIENAEKGILVPYQELREYAKKHSKTTKLVKEFREEDNEANVYLSFVDSDVVDFNGMYSSYLCYLGSNPAPTVMTTGYKFPLDNELGCVYKLASQVDRNIRVITNKYLPGAVYFPEPNLCVLVPKGDNTIAETFIDKKFRKGDLEAAALIREVRDRDDFVIVFIDGKPLLTTVPDRAKLSKVHKTPISFTDEFKQGASPTTHDVKQFKQVSQSHFHEKVWYDNLLINGCITVQGISVASCKSLLAKLRHGVASAVTDLKKHIAPEVVEAIVAAVAEIETYIAEFKIDYVRTEDEGRFLEVFQGEGGVVSDLSKEAVLILAQKSVIELIEFEVISPGELTDVPLLFLEEVFYNNDVIEMLGDEQISFKDLLFLYEAVQLNKDDFSEILQTVVSIVGMGGYSAEEVIKKYVEDTRHLEFMAGEPDEIVLEHSDDIGMVEFGRENYDVDIGWIRGELDDGRDGAMLMNFDLLIGTHEEYDSYSNDDHDDYEAALEGMGALDIEGSL